LKFLLKIWDLWAWRARKIITIATDTESSNMAAGTGNIHISRNVIDRVVISPTNSGFLTVSSLVKVSAN